MYQKKYFQSFSTSHVNAISTSDIREYAMAQLVEAKRYKPEGRGFDSRWCHWNFSLTQSFRPYYAPEVDSASKSKEYQKYFLDVKAAGA